MNKSTISQLVVILVCTLTVAVGALVQTPAPDNLENTYWAGTDAHGAEFVLAFLPSGEFRYTPSDGNIATGKWTMDRVTLTARTCDGKMIFAGTLEVKGLTGDTAEADIEKWTWSAIRLPLATFSPAPKFPAVAKAARVEGTVVVELEIAPDGKVNSARAVIGHVLLKPMSVAVAKTWTFERDRGSDAVRLVHLQFVYRELRDGENLNQLKTPDFWSPYQVEIVNTTEIM